MSTRSGAADHPVYDEHDDELVFLTVDEVGRQLRIRRSRVYELAASGLMPVVRLGRRLLFPRRGLEAMAEDAIARVGAKRASGAP